MKFVAFDLETTGTKPQEDMIVEIGAVMFDGSHPVKGYGVLVDPCRPIPPDASAMFNRRDNKSRTSCGLFSVMRCLANMVYREKPTARSLWRKFSAKHHLEKLLQNLF